MSKNHISNGSPEVYNSARFSYPESPIHGERGSAAVGAAVVIGMLGLVAIPVLGFAGNLIGSRVTQGVDEEKAHVEAEHLGTDNVNFACRTLNFFDATGSEVPLPLNFRGYEIPESWTKYTFNEGTIAVIETCQDDAKPSAVTSEEGDIITTESGRSIYMKVKVINTDNIVSDISFPKGNLDITKTEGAFMTGLNAASQNGKMALMAACLPAKLGAKATGNDIDCTEFSAFATEFVNKIETKGQITAEEAVLRAIQEKGSAAVWENHTLPAFIDSIACEVVQESGEDALEALRIKMTGTNPTPDFSKDMYDKYAGSFLAEKDSSVEVLPNVKIKELGETYVPECYSKAITDPTTGLTELLGK